LPNNRFLRPIDELFWQVLTFKGVVRYKLSVMEFVPKGHACKDQSAFEVMRGLWTAICLAPQMEKRME